VTEVVRAGWQLQYGTSLCELAGGRHAPAQVLGSIFQTHWKLDATNSVARVTSSVGWLEATAAETIA
jgi:hypothetical protein